MNLDEMKADLEQRKQSLEIITRVVEILDGVEGGVKDSVNSYLIEYLTPTAEEAPAEG